MGLACLWMVWFVSVCVYVCVCVGGGERGGGSSGVLVSKRAVLSYQNYIIVVSKQELF